MINDDWHWKVGDSIYSGNTKYVVEKVGRKWLKVSGRRYRVSIETLREDKEYGSSDKFYRTQEDMENAKVLGRRWKISSDVRDCLDVQKLKRIEDLLS